MGMYDGGLLNLALVRKFLISSLRVVYHYPSRWSKGRDEAHLPTSATNTIHTHRFVMELLQ